MPSCHVTLRGQKPPPQGYPREPKKVGEHLRKRRIDLELLQKDVAAILGVSAESVFHWETGLYEPANRYWPKIIAFLGFDPSDEAKTFRELILAVQRRTGFSQERLAADLGLDESTICRWLRLGKVPKYVAIWEKLEILFQELGGIGRDVRVDVRPKSFRGG